MKDSHNTGFQKGRPIDKTKHEISVPVSSLSDNKIIDELIARIEVLEKAISEIIKKLK
jgi:F0F1-type ATP synthase beta subunit